MLVFVSEKCMYAKVFVVNHFGQHKKYFFMGFTPRWVPFFMYVYMYVNVVVLTEPLCWAWKSYLSGFHTFLVSIYETCMYVNVLL